MATIRGNDGSVTTDGNVISKISSFEVDAEREIQEDTGMSDSAKTFKAGFLNWTARITCRFDGADTLGQKALLDVVLAASPSNVALVLTAEGSGPNYTGNALPVRFGHRQEIGSIVEIEFDLQGIGGLTYAVS